jgi:hypothetical protein
VRISLFTILGTLKFNVLNGTGILRSNVLADARTLTGPHFAENPGALKFNVLNRPEH